jgi:hypothetical protein
MWAEASGKTGSSVYKLEDEKELHTHELICKEGLPSLDVVALPQPPPVHWRMQGYE